MAGCCLALVIGCLCNAAYALERLDVRGLVEVQAFVNDGDRTWFDGGFTKLRHDGDSFSLGLGKAALNADYHLADTLWVRSQTTVYADDGLQPQVVEAYLHYRPVPRGPLRIRGRLGAFHLPMSLENRDLAWESRYSTTPSVINSWIGEELRTIGAEIELQWPGRFRASPHDFRLTAAIFGYNDPAGVIIAHRGWAAHDRQTGVNGTLRLPDRAGRISTFDPFREIDDEPGYYLGAAWSYAERVEVAVFHYDNRADPRATRGGQLAWRTKFNQVSLDWKLPAGFRLLGQYMTGDTFAVNQEFFTPYDNPFTAAYLLLSRSMGRHSFSARADAFDVDDIDGAPFGNFDETGRAWMLAWRYRYTDSLRLSMEWLRVDSKNEWRRFVTGQGEETADQFLFTVSYRYP